MSKNYLSLWNIGFKRSIYEISSKRLGLTIVYNNFDEAVGIITDGDIRRNIFDKYEDIRYIKAKDIMTQGFKSIDSNEMANIAWEKMNKDNISSLAVIENNKLVGVVTMHDVIWISKLNNKWRISNEK